MFISGLKRRGIIVKTRRFAIHYNYISDEKKNGPRE